MDDTLKQNLIAELGIDKLPAEKQEEILVQTSNLLFQKIFNKAIPLLSDKEQTEFEHLLDTASGDEAGLKLYQFLKTNIPSMDQIVKDEIAEFKRESLDVMSKIG